MKRKEMDKLATHLAERYTRRPYAPDNSILRGLDRKGVIDDVLKHPQRAALAVRVYMQLVIQNEDTDAPSSDFAERILKTGA